MSLYEDVVGAVREAHGLDDAGFAAHLRTLVSSLRELRTSYASGWGSVAVTYGRPVTEAYLLAYYPHYVGVTRAALDLLPPGSIPNSGRLRVCAFATGPAPEPVAIGEYLTANGYDTGTLALALYDIVPEQWRWAREVSIERILPSQWDRDVRLVDTAALDITTPGFADEVADRLALGVC